ncbi:hypothetical protein GCM10028816_10710 [Spirosoma lituiforme]
MDMKKLLMLVGVLAMGSQSILAQTTPTASQVIDKYIAAIGGKAALEKVTDVTTHMSSEGQRGAIMITRKQKLPNKFSTVVNANGTEVMRQIGNGSKVAMGGVQGSRTLEGVPAQQMTAINIIFPELHYAENGVVSTLIGPEKVANKDTYKISHTTSDGSATWTDNFDAVTGLKVQSVITGKSQRGDEVTTTMAYSDYRVVNGIKFPMTIQQQSSRGPMAMTVDNVRINRGLRDSDFRVK